MKYKQTEATAGTPEMCKRLYPCHVVVCREARLELQASPPYMADSLCMIGTVCGDLEAALDCILSDLENRITADGKERLPLSETLSLRSRMKGKFGPGVVNYALTDYPDWAHYGYGMSFEIHPVLLPGTLVQRILDSEPADWDAEIELHKTKTKERGKNDKRTHRKTARRNGSR